MAYEPRHMKWWGWGDEDTEFNAQAHPGFWPYARAVLGIERDDFSKREWKLEAIELPEPCVDQRFLHKLRSFLSPTQISDYAKERVLHAYGKGFRDLFRLRRGLATGAPDLVVYPESERDVCLTLRAAAERDVIVIPFGGGSNISGCLERMEARRMSVSLDMRRLRRVRTVDSTSCTARIESGIFGPDLEQQLGAYGVTLGHYPDSFLHSTLGGWIATRSAGMQSDRYGKIEDMVVAVRMVTSEGVLATRTVPKSSNGIDVNHLCIGSEGTLGVITEATMRVHLRPESRLVLGYLFPDVEGGIEAMHECVRQECMPAMVRLNDPDKTALSLAFRPPGSRFSKAMSSLFKGYLRMKGLDLPRACLMLTAFEGRQDEVARQLSQVQAIYRRWGAIGMGESSGKSFEATKYDFPHIRDFLLDRDVTTDVSETSTVWSNILPLYRETVTLLRAAILESGVSPWVGCHISHTYQCGASVYFTFGFRQQPEHEMEQYLRVKRAVQQSFIDHGATLSHHHAVGTEHLPWLAADISPLGVQAVAALKRGLDPGNIMNPGRLQPSSDP
ncbi:MAG TPA: FAD-binding oxidoreductase [Terriglobales bacterium]|nr:FAD-binding oxidoreductase [Terriglobales bacterium]